VTPSSLRVSGAFRAAISRSANGKPTRRAKSGATTLPPAPYVADTVMNRAARTSVGGSDIARSQPRRRSVETRRVGMGALHFAAFVHRDACL
jgi:hypothetical protein